MELFQLEQFVAIARSRTMRDAAEKMHVSQSALSQNLKKLEAELGCTLFERAHNQLALTSCGEILLESAQHALDELRCARESIAAEQQRLAQQVRIGCSSSVFAYFELPQIASSLAELNLTCTIAPDAKLARGLAQGDFDAIITADENDHGGMAKELLFEEQALLSVPGKSKLAKAQQLSLSELANIDLLVVSDMPGLSEWYAELMQKGGVTSKEAAFVESDAYLRDMEKTPACHFTTTFMQRYVSYATQRTTVPLVGEGTLRRTYLMWRTPDQKRLTPLIEAMLSARDHLFGGSAFLPFLMNGKKTANLEIVL